MAVSDEQIEAVRKKVQAVTEVVTQYEGITHEGFREAATVPLKEELAKVIGEVTAEVESWT